MINIRHFPFHLGLSFTFGSAFMLCQASLPALAQTGNQSDVTGAIVTTSDITGGTFAHSTAGGRGRVVFTRSTDQAIVNQGAVKVLNQLNIITLTSPVGNPIPSETQQNLLSVLTASGSLQANASSGLTNALSSVQGGPTVNQAQQLVSNLQGLLTTGLTTATLLENVQFSATPLANVQFSADQFIAAGNTLNSMNSGNFAITSSTQETLLNVFPASRSEQGNVGVLSTISIRYLLNLQQGQVRYAKVNPTRLVAAAKAYNDLIDSSSAQFLNNPPPELLAIQSVLLQLIKTLS